LYEYGPTPPVATAVSVVGVPTIGAVEVVKLVTSRGADAPIVTDPAVMYESYGFVEPAFLTHIWKRYVPAAGGTQVQVEDGLQSCPTVHVTPL
jgi:hypothetical protein